MKLACCQFAPTWGDWKANADLVDTMLKDYQPGDMDVLVLPEMALTGSKNIGYVFQSVPEILPFLEDAQTGPTVTWAKRQAIRLQCHVIVGYPETALENGVQNNYNSLCCVSPQGKLIHTYRKTFLYKDDYSWAKKGPGYVSRPIPNLGQVGFGICMDLNPEDFIADFEEYEFARFHLAANTDLLLCCMAWLRSATDLDNAQTNVLNTVRYWEARLSPLTQKEDPHHHTHVVICNRTGFERGATFAGGSCVMDISRKGTRLLDHLLNEQGVLMVEL